MVSSAKVKRVRLSPYVGTSVCALSKQTNKQTNEKTYIPAPTGADNSSGGRRPQTWHHCVARQCTAANVMFKSMCKICKSRKSKGNHACFIVISSCVIIERIKNLALIETCTHAVLTGFQKCHPDRHEIHQTQTLAAPKPNPPTSGCGPLWQRRRCQRHSSRTSMKRLARTPSRLESSSTRWQHCSNS